MSNSEERLSPALFQNDRLTVSVQRGSNCSVTFDLSAHPPLMRDAQVKAIKAVKREVTVPGFRKGKAPDHYILQNYSSHIQQELVEEAFHLAFSEAVALTGITPHSLKQSRPQVERCDVEKGGHFSITFETRPEIPSIDLNAIHFDRVSPQPITEEQLQQAIKQMRSYFATYEPIEGRPVQEGDVIDASLVLLSDPPQEVFKNERGPVTEQELSPPLFKAVLGLNAGESAEGKITPPQSNEETEEVPTHPFRITVHAIWKAILPDMDETLAKKQGAPSVEALIDSIRGKLEEEEEERIFELNAQALSQFLLSHYPIALPPSMIEEVVEDECNRLKKGDNAPPEAEWNQLRAHMAEAATRGLQMRLLLRRCEVENHLTLDQNEYAKEVRRQIGRVMRGERSSSDLNALLSDKASEEIHRLAMNRKVRQFLINHARPVEPVATGGSATASS